MNVVITGGDVLAAFLMMVPALAAVRLLEFFAVEWTVSKRVDVVETLAGFGILGFLALWSWGLWELAHWIAG